MTMMTTSSQPARVPPPITRPRRSAGPERANLSHGASPTASPAPDCREGLARRLEARRSARRGGTAEPKPTLAVMRFVFTAYLLLITAGLVFYIAIGITNHQ